MAVTTEQVKAAIERLASLDIINSPAFWMSEYRKTQYLDELIVRCGTEATGVGPRSATIREGVDALVKAGIIKSPDYWYGKSGFVGELLKALGGAKYTVTNDQYVATEQKLRALVCSIIGSWVGAKRGSKIHKQILQIYNTHRPLARNYVVKVTDPHCATTVSAAFIEAGISKWTGTECSCTNLMNIAKAKGYWVEDDKYSPKLGDACVYDWQDGANFANTDNRGQPDHIGIVTKIGGGRKFTVTEGNINGGRVGVREMSVNGRYIRGFIAPDYAKIAKEMNAKRGIRLYTVKSGDSLYKIASETLGQGSRWKEIADLNGLKSSVIYAGQVLKLPEK